MADEREFAFLEVRNWHRYQSSKKGGSWIKDYVDREDDYEYGRLTMFQRGVLDGICRLRSRLAHNIHNDPTYIARALHTIPRDRPHLTDTIHTLITRRFLIPTNQQLSPLEERRLEEIRGEERRKSPSTHASVREPPEIQETKQETMEEIAEDLPFSALAKKVIEETGTASNPQMLSAVANALEFCVKQEGRSKNSAVEFLIAKAREEIHQGAAPNKFWFDDRKWRKGNGRGDSKAGERNADNLAAVISQSMGAGFRGNDVSDGQTIPPGTHGADAKRR